MMEIAASIWMLPEVRRDIDWKWLTPFLLGVFVGTPGGVWLLASLPAETTRLLISVGIALLSVASLIFRTKESDSESDSESNGRLALSFLTGAAAGIANGLAAVAGLVAAIFLLLSAKRAARIRASLVALFLVSDIFALLWGGGFGLVGAEQF